MILPLRVLRVAVVERAVLFLLFGRLYDTTRRITVATAATAPADLDYDVNLCAEHAVEYDREAL